MPAPIQPWDRQPNESKEAFEAFRIYRDAGADRTVAQVAPVLGKSPALIYRWSSRWNWLVRIEAYERELDREWQTECRARLRSASRRHANMATSMIGEVAKELARLRAEQKKRPMKAMDLARWADVAVRIERLAYGGATGRLTDVGEEEVIPPGDDDESVLHQILGNPDALDHAKGLVRSLHGEHDTAEEPGGPGPEGDGEVG